MPSSTLNVGVLRRAREMQGRELVIDGGYVRERLDSVLQDQDLSRYIL
jgi:ATP-dependent protease HslVU (ClpYQ) ATPase subunit